MPKTQTSRATGGELVKQWLDREEMTQRAMAGLLEITEAHLSAIISGRDFPSLNVAVKLEERTGIPAREFAKAS